jgi:regulator of cell morphogenesis and NO signaling
MTATTDTTIRDIVAGDYRAASVFHRYGIDFCCGGQRTVDEACRAKQLSPAQVLADVAAACTGTDETTPAFATWDVSTLVAYIIAKHHAYVRGALPTIAAYTQKLAAVHGENHPELLEVRDLFAEVADEMTSHMMKEEQILFPFISALGDARKGARPAPFAPFGTVENPIHMMEQEHESAGNAMARINELTRGYEPPADACTTYKVGLQELDAFERDLHAHVHLENNILFPKALRLEGELR